MSSNRNNKSNSGNSRTTTTNNVSTATRRIETSQVQARPQTTPVTQVSTPTTTRRPRKPMTIRVRITGEEIRRVPVERSGYRVIRYEGRYHTIRGGGRTAPYIIGAEDSDDVLGRA